MNSKKHTLKIAGISIWRILAYFIIYSIAGYVIETAFGFLTKGVLESRKGFLYGPFCPIYGLGAVFLSTLKPLKKNPILLFISSIIITGLVEFIIGYISINIFNLKLWDYTGLFLNIKGLVCLRSVLTFAIGSLLLNYILIPIIDKYYNKNIRKYLYIIICIFTLDIITSILYRNPYTF